MKVIAIPLKNNQGMESIIAASCEDGDFYLFAKVEDKNVIESEIQEVPKISCSRWSCRANKFLEKLQCDVVIAPKIGKGAWRYFKKAKIEMVAAKGEVAKEAIDAYLKEEHKIPSVNEYCPFSHEGMYTATAHAGGIDTVTGSVMPPIYQTSTFAFENALQGANRFAGKEGGFIYTRMGNPTVRALENSVAFLEGGWGGLATSTGMAAVVTVFMTFLGKDLHIVSTDSVYGPSRVVVERDLSRFGVEYSFVNTANLNEIEGAMKSNTRLVFIETPANPTIKLTDIAGAAKIAHEHNALLVVDNTFMSPYLQRPFELGADVVIHSMTKFLNGHSDVVAGMIVPKTEELYQKLYKTLTYFGGTIDPHQAYLVVRGVKTLAVRMEKCQANAIQLAEYLENHPKVEWVKYPGLKSHPQYELAKKQMKGPGALLSFGVKGGLEAGRTIMDSVKVHTLAVSLGGVESLIQHPASMTHAAMAKEDREKAGITDGMIRISVGCEDIEDLKNDLEEALAKI